MRFISTTLFRILSRDARYPAREEVVPFILHEGWRIKRIVLLMTREESISNRAVHGERARGSTRRVERKSEFLSASPVSIHLFFVETFFSSFIFYFSSSRSLPSTPPTFALSLLTKKAHQATCIAAPFLPTTRMAKRERASHRRDSASRFDEIEFTLPRELLLRYFAFHSRLFNIRYLIATLYFSLTLVRSDPNP